MNGRLRNSGLLFAPASWVLNTQIGQITPYLDCDSSVSWTAIASTVLLLASAAGILAARNTAQPAGPWQFIIDVGVMLALAFIFALLMQEAASVLLNPCQR